MQLLLNKNEKSAKAVSSAMLHFLTVTSTPVITEEKNLESEENISISFKLRKIVDDLRNFTFSELKRSVVDEKPVIPEPNDTQKVQQLMCPSPEDYFQCDLFTIMLLDSQLSPEKSSPEKEVPVQNDGVLTLISALRNSDFTAKCELLKTLPAILNEENNKRTFLDNFGDEILMEISQEFSPESMDIYFDCLEELIVDKIRVKDAFFFELLFKLLKFESVKEKAMEKIEDILMRDWRNVILALRMKLPLFMKPFLHLNQSPNELEMIIKILKRCSETAEFSNLLVERTLLETGLELNSTDLPSSLFLFELCSDFILEKRNKFCKRLLILEFEGESFVTVFTSVTAILISESKGEGVSDIIRVLGKFVDIIVFLFECSHVQDLIEVEKSNQNKFLDLLTDKNESQNLKFSNKISCKNICSFLKEGIKSYLQSIISKASDLSNFAAFFESSNKEYVILKLLTSILGIEDELVADLSKRNHLIYQIFFRTSFSKEKLLLFTNLLIKRPVFLSSLELLEFDERFDIRYFGPSLEKISVAMRNPEFTKEICEKIKLEFFIFLLFSHENNESIEYLQTLLIFDFKIGKLSNEEVDSLIETIFNYKYIKRKQPILDILGLIACHLCLEPQNSNLIERICSSEHFFNFMGYLNSQEEGTQEIVLKIIILLSTKKKLKLKSSYLVHSHFTAVPSSESRCQTLFYLLFWELDSLNFLFPSSSSAVSQTINRGSISELVIESTKKELESQKNTLSMEIKHFDYLKTFFSCVKSLNNETFKHEIIRMLNLQMSPSNMEILLEETSLEYFHDYLRGAFEMSPMTKASNLVIEMLVKLFVHDITKNQKATRFMDFLKRCHDDDEFIIEILNSFISFLCTNSTLVLPEQQNLLKNFSSIINSMEELIKPSSEMQFMIIQCINLLACKNVQARPLMKSLGIFEARDNMLINFLKSDQSAENIHNLFELVSLDSIASQSKFRESNAIAYLLKILLQEGSKPNLQISILKLFRSTLSTEENFKYVLKIIESLPVSLYLFPNIEKPKESGFARCLQSKRSGEYDDEETKIDVNSDPEEFLEVFNSEKYLSERKQILLKLQRVLIPVQSEIAKVEMKNETKIKARKTKIAEMSYKDSVAIQKSVNELELKISSKISKSLEKTVSRFTKRKENSHEKRKTSEEIFTSLVVSKPLENK